MFQVEIGEECETALRTYTCVKKQAKEVCNNQASILIYRVCRLTLTWSIVF